MGVTLDDTMNTMRDSVYTFRAHKGIYHKIDQLVSRDGTPRYLQLYFYDPDTELDHRLRWPNLDERITKMLTSILSTNTYVNTFRSLAELGPLDNYRVTLNASVELDQRVYNRPTTSEVAGIWVEGNDNITSYKRSIVVYGRYEYSQTIQPYFGCYDPLSYPLFFPNEANTRSGRTTVAMREYYCYKFQIRSTENAKIRADLYQGIVDCVNAGEVLPRRIGKRIVLPAYFIGGSRDMRRRFLDAMTLVQDDGKPDLFLTMTYNPGWPGIRENLKDVQTAQDRPYLVSRVFRAKLEDLKEQLFKKHLLGEVKAYIYIIEFQKRGLPYAHFLLIMYSQHKISNPDHYDKVVCAEIPNILRERDKRTMLTAFFDTNRADETTRKYLYKDFPKHFTWTGGSSRWTRRLRKSQLFLLIRLNEKGTTYTYFCRISKGLLLLKIFAQLTVYSLPHFEKQLLR
ncbi:uncharacterized protein LOC143609647 [Bidens hawaiensis]|uniref:uncharacterized protein LOC143609647 n=1 Tax=Bidens hawaiensis TaxID=980011 RepID=UPI00404A674C